ncbi:MAG: hypothetical protein IJ501_04380 [Bacilli bacterium]|nr:hypothetical protein [Bacilli bacterium]
MNEVEKIKLEEKKKILMAIRTTLGSLGLECNSGIEQSDITDENIEKIYQKIIENCCMNADCNNIYRR